MSPDDERHGSYAGAVAHWLSGGRPCDDCARAEWRYRKTRKLRHLRGDPVTMPAIGITRRIRALHALGWTGPVLAAECGLSINTIRSFCYKSERIHAPTAQAVINMYARLSMTRPEGQYAGRARTMSARKGWPPPLAWDDIDDPDEKPRDWQYKPAARAEVVRDLLDRGAGISEACRVLHCTRDALEKWFARHDKLDELRILVGREHGMNRWNEGAA